MITLTDTASALGGGTSSTIMLVVWVVVIIGFMYFGMIRPQKKERKKMEELVSSIEIGDVILTTSGFYGVVIDIADDTIIVEFGNNKNCRIPMQKTAVTQVEKANAGSNTES